MAMVEEAEDDRPGGKKINLRFNAEQKLINKMGVVTSFCEGMIRCPDWVNKANG